MVTSINKAPKRSIYTALMLWIGTMLFTSSLTARHTFVLPPNGSVIGDIQHAAVQEGDTLATIGMRYGMGGYEMVEANPGVSYSHPHPGSTVIIPSRFVLPDAPREGIVINLAEMRLYYYHPDKIHVSTYPVGVGQEGWNTPLGKTQIIKKRLHPTWVVPESILANHLAHGEVIPKVKGPGPDNPLGDYAMNLGFPSIVIHGTPYPKAVGIRSSHGCIRMINEDAGDLFEKIKVGTSVNIIHQPTKIGRLDDKLYLEAHVPISQELYLADYHDIGQLIHKVVTKIGKQYSIEWHEVEKLQHRASGIPLPIGAIH